MVMPSRRHVLKAGTVSILSAAVGSSVVSADSDVDWEEYKEALSQKYSEAEAERGIQLAKQTVSNPLEPSVAEVRNLHQRIAADSQTGKLGDDFSRVISRQNNSAPVGTAPNIEGKALNLAASEDYPSKTYEYEKINTTEDQAGVADTNAEATQDRFETDAKATLVGSAVAEVVGVTPALRTILYNTTYRANIEFFAAGTIQNVPEASYEAVIELITDSGDIVERRVLANFTADGEYSEGGKISMTFGRLDPGQNEYYIRVQATANAKGGLPDSERLLSKANFGGRIGRGLYNSDIEVERLGFNPR
jgi:hypothetical protein